MPGKTTIMKWLESNLEFRGQYLRARELQAEHWAEEIIEIADDSKNDFVEKDGRGGIERREYQPLQVARRYPQMADGSTGPQEIRRQGYKRIGRRSLTIRFIPNTKSSLRFVEAKERPTCE